MRQSSYLWNKPVTPEVAGSSPVAPVEKPWKQPYFVVAPENTIEARAANGQERDERGAVVGAEADASLPGS